MSTAAARLLLTGALTFVGVTACSDDDAAPSTTSSTTTEGPGTTAPQDPELAGLLITASDLPDGFSASDEVDDTITTFCAGQDAAAGLSARGRALTGFTRTPEGASVIEVVLRFNDDGAARFVDQAEELFASCSGVPDATGLAFTYEPLSEPVAASLEGTAESSGRFGTSVGSGDLTVQVAVLRQADLGVLVAVLGLEQPRTESDALARAAFDAAVRRLGAVRPIEP